MKVMTVVGTRPEIIRLARVMAALDAAPGVEHVLVHTGQNWDHRLNGIFFQELGLRLPDHVLDVDVSSLGATLGDILRRTEAVLLAERPDAFLVLGDTNSALSLIMAKRLQIPTYHMEAVPPLAPTALPPAAQHDRINQAQPARMTTIESGYWLDVSDAARLAPLWGHNPVLCCPASATARNPFRRGPVPPLASFGTAQGLPIPL